MSREVIIIEGRPVKLKICLVGEGAVGKTSLIRRFVTNTFDDKYIVTLGANVMRKEVKIKNPINDTPLDVQMLIWDIVGEQSFRQMLKESYFFGSHGLMATCDLTRENTLSELHNWVESVEGITDKIPAVVLGNKSDLGGQQVGLEDIKRFASKYENFEPFLSSAKTGQNVELAFKTLSEKILEGFLHIKTRI